MISWEKTEHGQNRPSPAQKRAPRDLYLVVAHHFNPGDEEKPFMAKRNQHVVPHPNGWAVRPEGGQRPSSVHSTQEEAITQGKERAQNQGSELLIHGRNGQIRERNTYGKDPYPPKG